LVCISQAVLEPASGGAGALLFSQCNMAWRNFVMAGGSGCQSFAYSWCFFPTKCCSSVSARFFIYRAHAVTLVTILDPQPGNFYAYPNNSELCKSGWAGPEMRRFFVKTEYGSFKSISYDCYQETLDFLCPGTRR
jgi:hypothetical protein